MVLIVPPDNPGDEPNRQREEPPSSVPLTYSEAHVGQSSPPAVPSPLIAREVPRPGRGRGSKLLWICRTELPALPGRFRRLSTFMKVFIATMVVLEVCFFYYLITRPNPPSKSSELHAATDPNGDPPPSATLKPVSEDAADVADFVEEAAKATASVTVTLGQMADRFAESMILSRYPLTLTPLQEAELLANLETMDNLEYETAVEVFRPVRERTEKLEVVEQALSKAIIAGNGPEMSVRRQFADVESKSQVFQILFSYSQMFSNNTLSDFVMHPQVVKVRGRMVRGQSVTAAEVAKAIYSARLLADAVRQHEQWEVTFNDLVRVTFPEPQWSEQHAAKKFYGSGGSPSPEACLKARLDACSACFARLYAHASRLHSRYFKPSPNVPYTFEFPALLRDEKEQVEAYVKTIQPRQ
jgi:hypothetical protein